MAFELWPAILAGVLAGLVMMAVRMAMKAAGVPLQMDVTRIWGTMMKVHGGAGRVLGAMVHLVVSAAIALLYAWGFDLVGAESSLWLWGLLGGAVHWIVAGMMLAVLPYMHPEIPEERAAPGAFAKNFGGPDIAGFLVGHLVYGLTVGILYAWFT